MWIASLNCTSTMHYYCTCTVLLHMRRQNPFIITLGASVCSALRWARVVWLTDLRHGGEDALLLYNVLYIVQFCWLTWGTVRRMGLTRRTHHNILPSSSPSQLLIIVTIQIIIIDILTSDLLIITITLEITSWWWWWCYCSMLLAMVDTDSRFVILTWHGHQHCACISIQSL